MKKSLELETPQEYWDMNESEANNIVNKCGPDGFLNKIIPDNLLGLDVSASCSIHDYMFSTAKTSHELKIADKIFLKNMNEQITSSATKNPILNTLRRTIARLYYVAVRAYSYLQRR